MFDDIEDTVGSTGGFSFLVIILSEFESDEDVGPAASAGSIESGSLGIIDRWFSATISRDSIGPASSTIT